MTPIQPTYSAPFLSRLHTLSLFFSLSRWIDTSLLFPSRIFPLASAQPSSGSSFSVPRRFSFSVFIPIGLSPSHSFSILLDGCPFLFCCARRRMFPSLSRYRVAIFRLSVLHTWICSIFVGWFFLLRGGSALLSFPIILDFFDNFSCTYILFRNVYGFWKYVYTDGDFFQDWGSNRLRG